MRTIISDAIGFVSFLVADLRQAVTRRFGFSGRGTLGASSWGGFIHLPFTSRSLWVEWRQQSVGYGIERADPKNTEFFAGRIQGVLSVEGVR